MKQIEATILGQSYVLGCPEGGESSLLAAVAAVDTEMSAIRDAGRVKARERIAVLAALNLAYKLADQPVSATAVNVPAPPVPAASAATAADGVDLDALVARIDRLLHDDGLLL